MRVALVGVGRMGEAVLSGIVAHQGAEGVVVVNRRPERDEELVERHGVRAAPLPEAVADAEVVLVAVKPAGVVAVLDELRDHLAEGAVVLSVAAGMPLAVLAAHLDEGAAVVRVMPNTPAMVGRGISALSPGEHVDDEQLQRATEVMRGCGEVIVVPEEQQDAVTAVSGSGPAYLYAVAEAMAEAGVQLGLTRQVATTLANHTVAGAGAMLVETGEHPTILRENVTSPGGTTAQALKVLDERAVRAAFSAAMAACHDTSAAMARRVLASEGIDGGR